ncbi:uncharacterized protein LAESUDRAFT_312391 [Laetiporus sulphureus 93-53]|uniref:Uncharacterized protein n=1 Tax=Laetiporus sulphureus 93-53 TaxID=1314785 RepID=A0A165D561_9APHY|nr:uncharacterized protein LAESUDRAFT_312391 [Laetiporus sulphureus 93-53]KZT04174.1 hypothetical protein LAESUDRAFT_312391 [Laetiporus sulphureus 93-53]
MKVEGEVRMKDKSLCAETLSCRRVEEPMGVVGQAARVWPCKIAVATVEVQHEPNSMACTLAPTRSPWRRAPLTQGCLRSNIRGRQWVILCIHGTCIYSGPNTLDIECCCLSDWTSWPPMFWVTLRPLSSVKPVHIFSLVTDSDVWPSRGTRSLASLLPGQRPSRVLLRLARTTRLWVSTLPTFTRPRRTSPVELDFYKGYFSYPQSEKPFAMQQTPRRLAEMRKARTARRGARELERRVRHVPADDLRENDDEAQLQGEFTPAVSDKLTNEREPQRRAAQAMAGSGEEH